MTKLLSVFGVLLIFELSCNTALFSVLAQSNAINVNNREPFAGFSVIRPAEIQIYVRRSGHLKVLVPFEIDVTALHSGASGVPGRPAIVATPSQAFPANYNRPAQRQPLPIYYRPAVGSLTNNYKPFPVLQPQYRPIAPRVNGNRAAWPQYQPAQRVDSINRFPLVREYPPSRVVVQDTLFRNPSGPQLYGQAIRPYVPATFASIFTQAPLTSPLVLAKFSTEGTSSTTEAASAPANSIPKSENAEIEPGTKKETESTLATDLAGEAETESTLFVPDVTTSEILLEETTSSIAPNEPALETTSETNPDDTTVATTDPSEKNGEDDIFGLPDEETTVPAIPTDTFIDRFR